MKKIILLFIVVTSLSCSNEDLSYLVVKGKVVRESDNSGVPNAKIYVRIETPSEPNDHPWAFLSEIDNKTAVSDENGNFSVTLKNRKLYDIVSIYKMDDDYTTYQKSYSSFDAENLIIPVRKYEKLKVFVNNVAPFDSNDRIDISILQPNLNNNNGTSQIIQNFGNTSNISGFAVWIGNSVNSIINTNLQENYSYKILWKVTKNGVTTNFISNSIDIIPNSVNEFHINY